MICLTQLVYVYPGREAVFEEFEAAVIPLLARYQGELMLRLRPGPGSVVSATIEVPYEMHLIRFPSEQHLNGFSNDPERLRWLHYKQASVRAMLLVKGSEI